MKDDNKNVWMIVGAVVVILIIVLAVRFKMKDVATDTPVDTTKDMTALESTEDSSTGNIPSTDSAGKQVTRSYASALIEFNGRRIQLNDVCAASPTNMTFKNNTSIMIDNRSATPRTFKLGSTYTVKGYGFKIINLSSTKLPQTYLMDCGTQQNVATILLQK
jgi:hypothetical protein